MDDAPPPDFAMLDSPNEGETGTFACPFDGCDGVVCASAQDCHLHLREWHSPPYACAGCDASFAAQSALARHVKATGHGRWVCAKQECEMRGFEFETHLEYRNHVIASDSHRSLGQRAVQDGAADPDDTLSEDSAADYFMCLEPCCCRYLQRWTGRMYDVHVKGHCHVAAAQEGDGLRKRDLSESELEEKQHACRNFLCDAPGCPQFGKCLSSSKSYYHHIQTWNHLFPAEAAALKDEDEDDFWLGPDVRRCTVHGCLQFGRRFTAEANYQRHIKSVQHLRASCGRPTRGSPRNTRANRRLFVTEQPAEEKGDEMPRGYQTSPRSFPAEPSALSETPPALTPDSGLGSPTPSGLRRERFLERRNRQLEDEVQRLQAQMDWLCRQN